MNKDVITKILKQHLIRAGGIDEAAEKIHELITEIEEDHSQTITSLCNSAWQGVYSPDRTDWEYPAQAVRHLKQHAEELKEQNRNLSALFSATQHEIREQISDALGYEQTCDAPTALKTAGESV